MLCRAALLSVASVLVWCDPTRAEETLEPLVVTTPRLEGEAQRAPGVITVLTGDQLEASQVESTPDLGTLAPNLVVQQGGDRRNNYFQIRGLTNTPFAGEGVGLYVDGIPYVDQRAAAIPLYDVDVVEVFNGPQNLRFGRNADGGAIHVLTRQPGAQLTARASALYGNFGTQIYEGAVGGPLGSDRVRFRLAGIESLRDGYIENTFLDEPLDDRNLLAGRGMLLLLPLPELAIEFTGEAQHADDGSRGLVLLGVPDPFRVAYNTPGSEQTDTYLGALRAAYACRFFHLTSLTARRSFDAGDSTFDADFSPRNELVLIEDDRFVDWTQEVRVASPDDDGRWRWQLGAFLEDTVTHPRGTFVAESTAFIQATPPAGLGLPFTAPVFNTQRARLHSDTQAGFGEITTTALAPFEVTTGLRYQHDRVRILHAHALNAQAQGVKQVTGDFEAQTSSSAWLPQVTLGYRVRPSLLLYAAAAQGYRPGGFSYAADDPEAARFGPQRDWSWETGTKGIWPEWGLTAEAALFYILSRGFQVVQPQGPVIFTVANAARVTSRGFEVHGVAQPRRDLEVTASFGYTDARYDDFRLSGGEAFDGNAVQLVPPYNFSLAFKYIHRTGLTARVAYQGLGSYDFTEANTVGQGAYQLLNASLGWGGEHFSVSVFGQNLTDETYFSFPIPGGPGGDFIVAPGTPRIFGLMATARY